MVISPLRLHGDGAQFTSQNQLGTVPESQQWPGYLAKLKAGADVITLPVKAA